MLVPTHLETDREKTAWNTALVMAQAEIALQAPEKWGSIWDALQAMKVETGQDVRVKDLLRPMSPEEREAGKARVMADFRAWQKENGYA